jgi:hypothetical protein
MMVLQHQLSESEVPRLPRLRGVEVVNREREDRQSVLIFRLLEAEHRDIFERLGRDVIEQCRDLTSEAQVVQRAIGRTWRWHHLLRGGDGRLGEEAQKGLIGELLVLERLLIPSIGCNAAVVAWLGPVDAPKDFEIGRIAIEAKTRRGAAAPFVAISSEHQLETEGLDELFLHVIDLSRSSVPADGISITAVAERVRSRIAGSDPAALERFDSLLLSAGLDLLEEYEDFLWVEGSHRSYRVSDTFPRLNTSSVPQGVNAVQYRLSLAACEPHIISEAELLAFLTR